MVPKVLRRAHDVTEDDTKINIDKLKYSRLLNVNLNERKLNSMLSKKLIGLWPAILC